jgi:hypothetical protein
LPLLVFAIGIAQVLIALRIGARDEVLVSLLTAGAAASIAVAFISPSYDNLVAWSKRNQRDDLLKETERHAWLALKTIRNGAAVLVHEEPDVDEDSLKDTRVTIRERWLNGLAAADPHGDRAKTVYEDVHGEIGELRDRRAELRLLRSAEVVRLIEGVIDEDRHWRWWVKGGVRSGKQSWDAAATAAGALIRLLEHRDIAAHASTHPNVRASFSQEWAAVIDTQTRKIAFGVHHQEILKQNFPELLVGGFDPLEFDERTNLFFPRGTGAVIDEYCDTKLSKEARELLLQELETRYG